MLLRLFIVLNAIITLFVMWLIISMYLSLNSLSKKDNLKWEPDELPIRVSAPLSMKHQIGDDFLKACDTWNKEFEDNIFACSFEDYPAVSNNKNYPKNGVQRIFFTNDWKNIMPEKRTLAVTIRTIQFGRMKSSAIYFNMNYKFSFEEGKMSSKIRTFDFKTTLTHELGHVLGLGHIASEKSIMKPEIYSGEILGGLGHETKLELSKRYEDGYIGDQDDTGVLALSVNKGKKFNEK